MSIPVDLGEDWRAWTASSEYSQTASFAVESPDIQEMVKGAAAVVRHIPLEKLAATTVTAENIWRHKEAHPYALLLLLVDRYGNECLKWHPDLLQVRMIRDGINPSHSVWTKILAGRVLFTSAAPWDEWETFHWTSLGLAGLAPNFGLLEEPEVAHIVHAVSVMRAVHPERVFGEEVQKFIAAALRNESIIFAPYPIEFCQDELDDQKLRCTNCSAVIRDDGDRVCVTCGKETLKVVPHPLQAELDEIRTLWKTVKDLPLEAAVDQLPESYVGNSVYRLVVYWHDTLESQKALASQMLLLSSK